MLKKLSGILNIIIGSFVGAFIGRAIYVYWEYQKYPDLYAMQSAPWHTSIIVSGLFTVVVLFLAIAIKWFIRKN